MRGRLPRGTFLRVTRRVPQTRWHGVLLLFACLTSANVSGVLTEGLRASDLACSNGIDATNRLGLCICCDLYPPCLLPTTVSAPNPRLASSPKMISRRPTSLHALTYALLVFSLASARVAAQEAFDCKITIGESKWDLTSLKSEHTVSRERNTPPTKFRDTVTFNLCDDLTAKDGVAEKDQVSFLIGLGDFCRIPVVLSPLPLRRHVNSAPKGPAHA